MAAAMQRLQAAYPWIQQPLLVSAPMLGAATPTLAVNVSKAGGFGFLAGGTNPNALHALFEETKAQLRKPSTSGLLPVGVGFQLFNTSLDDMMPVIQEHLPAAIWLFAAGRQDDYERWAKRVRAATAGKTAVWVQVGTVAEAKGVLAVAHPDVLVMQGMDAGGHGLKTSASIISLVPEVLDHVHAAAPGDSQEIPILAAGGIVDAKGFAAALALGASGVVMGTRFLAAEEAGIAEGWKQELLRTSDGGMSTVRSTLCDRLKETKGWPEHYDGRAIRNKGHVDEEHGLDEAKNVELYKKEMRQAAQDWTIEGRLVAYAGTGIGLVRDIKPAASLVKQLRDETRAVLTQVAQDTQSLGDLESRMQL